jgi:hypothetical protein
MIYNDLVSAFTEKFKAAPKEYYEDDRIMTYFSEWTNPSEKTKLLVSITGHSLVSVFLRVSDYVDVVSFRSNLKEKYLDRIRTERENAEKLKRASDL